MRKFLEQVNDPCLHCGFAVRGIVSNSDRIVGTVRAVAIGCQLDECRLPEEVRPHIPCEKWEESPEINLPWDDEYGIVIQGRPITKKNTSNFYRNVGKLLPSKQFQAYERAALWQIRCQFHEQTIAEAVAVKALYYMPNRAAWPDLIGLEQATADILQDAGVIEDDGYIESWDGSRIAGIDKACPRVEITIRTLGEKSVLSQVHPKLLKMKKKGGEAHV